MPKQAQPYNLLIIEDNPGDFILLQQYLIRSKLPIGSIIHADRMARVPELITENKFDIALLDLSLPDSQGVDSVISLDRLLPHVPIVVFSGLSTIEIAIETISLGAQDYLIKGEFDEKILAKTVQYSMERKKTVELEKELGEQQLKQQKIITEVTIQAQEKERNELGRELHDNINQILATVKMYIGMIRDRDRETVPHDLISQCHTLITETMTEIRKLSHSLVAPSLGDIGLEEALLELVQEINATNKFHLELASDLPKDEGMDSPLELMLYRVVQEQINNILKHAQAKKVIISLRKHANIFYLSILDDGIGFDVTKAVKGIGLKNIQNRVEYYSGTMNIISSPGNGCTIDIAIPITKNQLV